ncbi:MAG: dCTP deaminase domain-containing protein [Candidatus Dormibacteria bacterium]
MSRVLTEVELKKAVTDQDFIVDGDADAVEGLKYDFTLGPKMLFGHRNPMDVSELPELERTQLVVKPGELVYVMSQEQLNLPGNIKAELSPKRTISHLGIMVLGGFCVDPGYKGRLVFALYNLATIPFPLEVGRKLIAAQFYRLDPEEVPPPTRSKPIVTFPEDLVQLMQAYEPATLVGVQQSVHRLESTVEELRRQLQDREDWFKKFQEFLKELGGRVDQVTSSVAALQGELAAESEARKTIGAEVGQLRTASAVSSARFNIGVALAIAILAALIILVLRG